MDPEETSGFIVIPHKTRKKSIPAACAAVSGGSAPAVFP